MQQCSLRDMRPGRSGLGMMRTDHIPNFMNRRKEIALLALLAEWRRAASAVAKQQWVLFQQTGRFDGDYDALRQYRKQYAASRGLLAVQLARRGGRDLDKERADYDRMVEERRKNGGRAPRLNPRNVPPCLDPLAAGKEKLGTFRVQMLRRQVAAMLQSWIESRKRDFVYVVMRSSLDNRTAHQLLVINKWQAWFRLRHPIYYEGGVISTDARRLAQKIMRRVFRMHRKPSMASIGMNMDARAVRLVEPTTAKHFHAFFEVATLEQDASGYKRVSVPVLLPQRYLDRPGRPSSMVNVFQRSDGSLQFAAVKDMTEVFKETRQQYKPETEVLALDFGLRTLFASDRGDLLGRRFIEELRRHDGRIVRAVKRSRRQGVKPTQFEPYVVAVRRLQGFLRTFINMVLNRAVSRCKPATIAVERLDFRGMGLSRRMNRLLSNCGRKVVNEKCGDLNDRLGIVTVEVNPAYTSQTCSACGYVDRRNRSGEAFICRFCGRTLHADVNGARNIYARRSGAWPGVFTKHAALAKLVNDFVKRRAGERHSGSGSPGDLRQHPPSCEEWAALRLREQRHPSRARQDLDLVGAVVA